MAASIGNLLVVDRLRFLQARSSAASTRSTAQRKVDRGGRAPRGRAGRLRLKRRVIGRACWRSSAMP